MKPKLKANELFEKYYQIGKNHDFDYAKDCALIAVDEILQLCWNGNLKAQQFWVDVKQEIENL